MAIALLVTTAIPALAWVRQTNYGTPGTVTPVDSRGAEGGICGDPNQTSGCTNSAYDAIYVERYRAYTTSAAVPQNIVSTTNLSYWSQGQWHAWKTSKVTCSNALGLGKQYCQFGHPASDRLATPTACKQVGCFPTFGNLPRGYYYAVSVTITWISATTGQTMAQATYHPTPSSADIGCASYAISLNRCSVYATNGWGVLYLP